MSKFINITGHDLCPSVVEDALKSMPYGTQDSRYLSAKVVARYYSCAYTAYVLENGNEEGKVDGLVYGIARIGNNDFEYGDLSLSEFAHLSIPMQLSESTFAVGVERDDSVQPLKMTLGECFAKYGEEVPMWIQEADRARQAGF